MLRPYICRNECLAELIVQPTDENDTLNQLIVLDDRACTT